jgi:hypothetical protein
MMPSRTASHALSPRFQFYGKRVDEQRDLPLGFGDYAEIGFGKTDNTMAPRTHGAIYMHTAGNLEGTPVFYDLSSGGKVATQTYVAMPTPQWAIIRLNKLASGSDERVARELSFQERRDGELLDIADEPGEPDDVPDDINLPEALPLLGEPAQQEYIPGDPFVIPGEVAANGEQPNGEQPPLFDEDGQPDVVHYDDNHQPDAGDAVDQPDAGVQEHLAVPDEQPQQYRLADPPAPDENQHYYGLRSRKVARIVSVPRARAEPREFGMHITPKRALQDIGQPAVEAIDKELAQMHDKKVWHPVHVSSLSSAERKSIIPSSMFLKEKFLPDGEFDKLKSRIVAGGHRQDRSVHGDDTSSPTVSTTALFALAALGAAENKAVATVDVPGAFLEASMLL